MTKNLGLFLMCGLISSVFAANAPQATTTPTAAPAPTTASPTAPASTAASPTTAVSPTPTAASNAPAANDNNGMTKLPDPVGRVVWIKGTFTATMPNNEKRILQKTSVIYLHDTLVTEANTQAQIVFTDNTLMTFRADTKFYIDQYAYEPKKKGSVGKYIVNLLEGGFRTITGIISKSNPNDYQVNTPVATIGVRGTDYAVYVHQGQLFVGYYSGEPCVENKKKQICLSKEIPYAEVPNASSTPVPVQQRPDVFKEKLEIVPAKIAGFTGFGAPGHGGGGGSLGTCYTIIPGGY